jgi:formyl-CoA transferase
MTARAGARPPLDGLVVLDFSHYVSAATCSMTLADLGATVIKVERSGSGDDLRALGPQVGGASASFQWANRNKRAIALDLKSAAGRQLARDLAGRADVLVENYSTGVMDRLGLGHEELRRAHPSLIYCSVSAYAREGPHAQRPGFDPVVQAECGLMSLNGPEGSPGIRVGAPVADTAAGFLAAIAVLGALAARQRDGVGQHVEVALYDSAIALAALPLMSYLANGVVPAAAGSASREATPTDTFSTQDGLLYIACPSNTLFARFATQVLERPDLVTDPRYATNGARLAHRDALKAEIEAVLRQQPRRAWMPRLLRAQVPAGEVQRLDEVVRSSAFVERGLLTPLQRDGEPTVPNLALPFRFDATPVAAPFRAPRHGEHTDEVLGELLGCSRADLARHAAEGAFGPSC